MYSLMTSFSCRMFAIAIVAVLWSLPTPDAVAQESGYVIKNKKRASKPLKGVIYGKRRRVGGYSYKHNDVIDTRKFVERKSNKQSEAGPFDSGFFFESPRSPHGGTAPYMH